jgi:hypothetical protein
MIPRPEWTHSGSERPTKIFDRPPPLQKMLYPGTGRGKEVSKSKNELEDNFISRNDDSTQG